jgi:ubiquinone/menaquinone biosynthesis C-methylase UbiE
MEIATAFVRRYRAPMPRSNRWNRHIYACWAPFYDLFVQAPLITRARGRAIEELHLQPGERVCLIGVGTGADFPFLPEGLAIEAVDLSPAMLAKARAKLPVRDCDITLSQANAEELPFPDQSFDVAMLTLILSVAGDGPACMREAVRIVRPGGRLLVFDKFLPPDTNPSLLRRTLNILTRFFGTDINRSFETLSAGLPVRILSDRPALLRGTYRSIVLARLTE